MLVGMVPNIGIWLWVEAVNTANYIWDLLTSTVLPNNETSHERIMGHKPDLSNLWVFGCTVYGHINKEMQKVKFSEKAKVGNFVGYCMVNSHRIYFPDSGKVISFQDVTFDEVKRPYSILEQSRIATISFEFDNDEVD